MVPSSTDTAPEFTVYLDHLALQRRYSAHTIAGYARDLAKLQGFAQISGHTTLAILSTHDIRRFAARLNAQGLNGRSIARALSAWRGYFAYLVAQKQVTANPVEGVRAPRVARLLPKALPVDEAQALAAFEPSDSTEDVRDHAIAELLYSSGLRLAELQGLDISCIKTRAYESQSWLALDECEAHVLGKGRKRRVVPVGSKAIIALNKWLVVRAAFAKYAIQNDVADSVALDNKNALFLSRRGVRLSARSIQARLAKLALQAGTASRVHPHVLRHSAASHLLQSSGDLRAVQEFLGHSSIASTQIYTRLDWQHLAKAYDAAHPRAKKK